MAALPPSRCHQIVIWNPGQLPDDWTLKKLLGKHPSRPFNPLVANALFRAGYIEAWGRGIKKIQRECREYDVPAPTFDHSMSGLMLTFHANPRRLKEVLGEEATQEPQGTTRDGLGGRLGETRAVIINAMLANPKVTTIQLAKSSNISTTAMEKHLRFLRSERYVERGRPGVATGSSMPTVWRRCWARESGWVKSWVKGTRPPPQPPLKSPPQSSVS